MLCLFQPICFIKSGEKTASPFSIICAEMKLGFGGGWFCKEITGYTYKSMTLANPAVRHEARLNRPSQATDQKGCGLLLLGPEG